MLPTVTGVKSHKKLQPVESMEPPACNFKIGMLYQIKVPSITSTKECINVSKTNLGLGLNLSIK